MSANPGPPPDDSSRNEKRAREGAAAAASRLREALALHERGSLDRAEALYRAILAAAPRHYDALHLLGVIRFQQGRYEAAVDLIRDALAINRDDARAHSNLGLALAKLKRHGDALDSHDRALALEPDNLSALNNRGNLLRELKRHAEALASYDRALALKADYLPAHKNRGATLLDLGRAQDALASYRRALALRPDDAEARLGQGNALMALKRPADALASYDRALAQDPDHVEARNNRGRALLDLNRPEEALASIHRALAAAPDDAEVLNNLGIAMLDLRRQAEALDAFDRALARNPQHADALSNRCDALLQLARPEDAVGTFARLLEVAPDYPFAKGQLLHAKMLCCDWAQLAPLAQSVTDELRAGRKAAEPFGYQAVASSPRDLRSCAEIYTAHRFPPSLEPVWKGERYRNARIRVGYVSGEFRNQAVAILMAGLYERHDKSRFELFAFDNGWDDGSEVRARIESAFDEVTDITRLGDREAAAMIHARRIDILVNLNGYFGRTREGVFAQRPCPVQVNYLGFPGTLGAAYMDYIVADAQVIAPGEEAFFREAVVRLPDSYFVTDTARRIAEETPRRADAGLPERGFVFCCFNNSYKITPEIFDVWMRLLRDVPDSVLWLLEGNAAVTGNLRREAERRGVAAQRLVFALHMKADAHLARHRLADLCLDTLPYNAHTTAVDALWMGLPVLTCTGSAFAGRVAASLLRAVGLPELITDNLQDYEALARRLATAPGALTAVRERLARRRLTHPLFDTDRFRRHLESAYGTMWARYQRGEAPAGFSVAPLS